MYDLIDRQAALAWCKKDDWGTPDEKWRPESEYGRYIETLPTAEPQWIPISKKHPEDSGLYLTTTMHGEVYADYWDGINFDRGEIKVEIKTCLTVSDEMAARCLALLEMW